MKEAAIQHDKRLGRGLSALFGESKLQKEVINLANGGTSDLVEMVPINKIVAGVYQPRIQFNESELEELADSIKEFGVIQPIILRRIEEDNHYEIIAGERRFRASRIAGLSEIPAIIKKLNNHEALELAIVENIQRSDLTLIEEANGYKQLIEEFSYTQDHIAKKVGKSRSHITNLLRLLTLPQNIHDLLNQNLISMGHARAIINSDNPEKLAKKIIEQSLTVRDTEELIRSEKLEKDNAHPVLLKTESKVKFINNEYLAGLEGKLNQILGMETKISYNSFKNNGKITIKFDDLEGIEDLIAKISQ